MESETVNTWELELPARIETAMKFPGKVFAVNARDAEVVVPASRLLC